MHLRTRAWIAVVGLATVVALPARGQSAELDKYLPDDAEFVTSINVKQLLDSQLVQKYVLPQAKAKMEQNNQATQILSMLGLDPYKDIHQITMAGPVNPNASKRVLIIAHGDFNTEKIHQLADQVASSSPEKLKIEKEGDTPIYVGENGNGYAALLSKHVLVAAGAKEPVTEAIAKHSGGTATKVSPGLAKLVKRVNGEQSIWGVTLVSADVKKQLAKNPQTSEFADKLESVSGGLTVTDEVKLGVHIHTTTADAADQINDTLSGLRGLATVVINSQAEQLKGMAPLANEVVKAVKFNKDKETASVELTLNSELIGKIAKAAQQLQQRQRGGSSE